MMKRLVKLCVSSLVYIFDYPVRRCKKAIGVKEPSTCVILYYHVVTPQQRERFASQLDDLIRWARPISLEHPESMTDGCHHAAVTFDDGYMSFLENALPELRKRNIPVALFVPSGCLGQHPPWIDKDDPEYQEVVMSAEQLKDLDSKYITIGSHCATHPNLLNLRDDFAKEEIFRSRDDLQRLLGQDIKFISFPHGAFKEIHVEYARAAGYKRAFSIIPSLAFQRGNDYMAGRVRVDPTDSKLEFRLKLLGSYRWLPFAFAVKKKLGFFMSDRN